MMGDVHAVVELNSYTKITEKLKKKLYGRTTLCVCFVLSEIVSSLKNLQFVARFQCSACGR